MLQHIDPESRPLQHPYAVNGPEMEGLRYEESHVQSDKRCEVNGGGSPLITISDMSWSRSITQKAKATGLITEGRILHEGIEMSGPH